MSKLIKVELLAAAQMLSEKNSYREAAQQLGITLSLLKKRIAALEEQLELHLFERHSKQITLTPEGRTFISAAHLFSTKTNIVNTPRDSE